MTVAEQVRRLSSLNRTTYHAQTPDAEFEGEPETDKSELANELAQTRANLAERDTALIRAKQWIEHLAQRFAELEQQVAQEALAPKILKDHVEVLGAQSAAASKRITELEGELGSARERLILRENDNRLLQTSLNLIVSENSRLSRRLAESEAVVDEANEKRRAEANTLNTCLEAMPPRVIAAEKLLTKVLQSLLAPTDEKRVGERKVVSGTDACDSVDKTLEQLQNPLPIKLPAERVDQLDAVADLVKVRKTIKALDFQVQCERKRRACENANTNCTEPPCELDNHVRDNGKYSERAEVRYTESLLAGLFTS
jgi:chromosome segregation ATPase